MKITCTRDNLNLAIQNVNKAVSLKSPKPILSGILFEAEEDMLVVTATDMDISIRCTVPVSVDEAGKAVVPARYIVELVRKLPDTMIELTTDDESNIMNISYGQSSLDIGLFDYHEFPLFPSLEGDHHIIIDEKILKQMIRQTIFAKSQDDSRTVFTGTLMEVEQDEMRLVSSDTHRLALTKTVLNQVSDQKYSAIIPGKTINELNRLLGTEEEVEIYLDNSQISFQVGNTNIISRLLEGKFPDYKVVIPQKCSTVVRVKTEGLLQSSERAALLLRENNGSVRLTVEDAIMTVNAATEAGKIYEEVPIEKKGDDVIIFFNVRYLCDVLRVIEDEEIFIEFNGPLNAGIIKMGSNDDFLSLLLPIRAV